ncbi:MAG: Gfo/Idh/MocA family oxidoreductase [Candidatus Latescibacteria bacterium]|nr:Gfo/Idh/MocA family oxidoreductase [Candidatus Latescibacterota bacterium]
MEKKVFGFGVIGCGLVSQFHGKAIQAAEGAKLVAAVDMVPERAAEFAQAYGGEALSSMDAIFARDDVDVVNVLTPNAYHEEYVVKAAQAGKHVLVEKPPEMTLEKVDRMIAACEENGVQFGVVLQCRFRKAIEAIRHAMEAGRFGRLLHGDAYMKWFRSKEYYAPDTWRSSREQGAGVTIQHAFHYIDLLHHLMGPVKQVQARMTNLAHPEVTLEDTVIAIMDYANGAQGVVEASTALYPGTDIRIEINGENGTAIMQGERIIEWAFREEKPEDAAIRKIGSESIGTAATGAADFAYFEHQYLIEDMIAAIREGRPPRITAHDGRGSLEIALAMYRSADEGKVVELPLSRERGA